MHRLIPLLALLAASAAMAQTQLPADRSVFVDGQNLQQKYDGGTLGVNEAVHLSGTGPPSGPCSNIGADRYTDTAAQTEYYCSATNIWTQYAGGSGGGDSCSGGPVNTPIDSDGDGVPETICVTPCYDGDCTTAYTYADVGAASDWLSAGIAPDGTLASWRAAVVAANYAIPKKIIVLAGVYWGRGGADGVTAPTGAPPRTGQTYTGVGSEAGGEIQLFPNTDFECRGAVLYGPRHVNTTSDHGGVLRGINTIPGGVTGGRTQNVTISGCRVFAGHPLGMNLEVISVSSDASTTTLTFDPEYAWPSGYFDGLNIGNLVTAHILTSTTNQTRNILSNTGNTIVVTKTATGGGICVDGDQDKLGSQCTVNTNCASSGGVCQTGDWTDPVAGDLVAISWGAPLPRGSRRTVQVSYGDDIRIENNEVYGSYHACIYGSDNNAFFVTDNVVDNCAQSFSLQGGDHPAIYSNNDSGANSPQEFFSSQVHFARNVGRNLTNNFMQITTDTSELAKRALFVGNIAYGGVSPTSSMGLAFNLNGVENVQFADNYVELFDRGVGGNNVQNIILNGFTARRLRGSGVDFVNNTLIPVNWKMSDFLLDHDWRLGVPIASGGGTSINLTLGNAEDVVSISNGALRKSTFRGISMGLQGGGTPPNPGNVSIADVDFLQTGTCYFCSESTPSPLRINIVLDGPTFSDLRFDGCKGACIAFFQSNDGVVLQDIVLDGQPTGWQGTLTYAAANAAYPSGACSAAQTAHVFYVTDSDTCPDVAQSGTGGVFCQCEQGTASATAFISSSAHLAGIKMAGSTSVTSRMVGRGLVGRNMMGSGGNGGYVVRPTNVYSDGELVNSGFSDVYLFSDPDMVAAGEAPELALSLRQSTDQGNSARDIYCDTGVNNSACVLNVGVGASSRFVDSP